MIFIGYHTLRSWHFRCQHPIVCLVCFLLVLHPLRSLPVYRHRILLTVQPPFSLSWHYATLCSVIVAMFYRVRRCCRRRGRWIRDVRSWWARCLVCRRYAGMMSAVSLFHSIKHGFCQSRRAWHRLLSLSSVCEGMEREHAKVKNCSRWRCARSETQCILNASTGATPRNQMAKRQQVILLMEILGWMDVAWGRLGRYSPASPI